MTTTDHRASGELRAGNTAHWFIQAGILLFLLGLLTGLAIPLMESPRMGVSSHLEGLLNGIFLVVLGLIWRRVSLPAWTDKVTAGLMLYGTFANWIATFLTGLWGAGGMTPVAGEGAIGTAAQEGIVAALLLSLSLAMVVGTALVLWGLRRGRGRHSAELVGNADNGFAVGLQPNLK